MNPTEHTQAAGASELLAKIAASIDPLLKSSADDIYERLLYAVQDHLIENAEYNIKSRIESAEREARWATKQRADLMEALEKIADESVFNQPRFAEDTDTDYFLRCFKAVKDTARAALARATGQA